MSKEPVKTYKLVEEVFSNICNIYIQNWNCQYKIIIEKEHLFSGKSERE